MSSVFPARFPICSAAPNNRLPSMMPILLPSSSAASEAPPRLSPSSSAPLAASLAALPTSSIPDGSILEIADSTSSAAGAISSILTEASSALAVMPDIISSQLAAMLLNISLASSIADMITSILSAINYHSSCCLLIFSNIFPRKLEESLSSSSILTPFALQRASNFARNNFSSLISSAAIKLKKYF